MEYPTGIRGGAEEISGSNGRRNRTRESREVEEAGRSDTADPPRKDTVILPQTASPEAVVTSGDTVSVDGIDETVADKKIRNSKTDHQAYNAYATS